MYIYMTINGTCNWYKFRLFRILVKLIDKMSLGVGALKVEGPIAQKGSLALEVTMATTGSYHNQGWFSLATESESES